MKQKQPSVDIDPNWIIFHDELYKIFIYMYYIYITIFTYIYIYSSWHFFGLEFSHVNGTIE